MRYQPNPAKSFFTSGLIALSLTLASCGGSSSGDDPEPAADQPTENPTPLDPLTPDTPTTPDVPATPTAPEGPFTPTAPTVPEEPATPTVPTVPEEPVTPTEPTVPEEPVTPTEPTAPEGPFIPTAPPIDDPVTPSEPLEPEPTDPTGLIVSVTSGDTQGEYFLGSPPETIGSVTLDALTDTSEPLTVISGGSLELPVESDVPFSTIFVNSDADGFFQLLLPEETTSASAIITYNTDLAASTTNEVNVAVQTPTGDVSSPQILPLETIEVGTGDVQVSVSWDTPTDVDIWLIEPDGTRIFWAFTQSLAGGMLDLDSNPACFLDNINNENITYEDGTPPSGEYTVVVDYFSDCGVATETNFVVTVRANGTIRTIPGVFVPGDADVEVARFIIP